MRGWRAGTGLNLSFEGSYGRDIRHIGTFRFDYFGMNRARNSTNRVWSTLIRWRFLLGDKEDRYLPRDFHGVSHRLPVMYSAYDVPHMHV